MAEVRPDLSNPAYGASHTFVQDWRSHRVWDWLNGSLWKFIPSDERVLDAQVRPVLVLCVRPVAVATSADCGVPSSHGCKTAAVLHSRSPGSNKDACHAQPRHSDLLDMLTDSPPLLLPADTAPFRSLPSHPAGQPQRASA
jgi:hypothetical protein